MSRPGQSYDSSMESRTWGSLRQSTSKRQSIPVGAPEKQTPPPPDIAQVLFEAHASNNSTENWFSGFFPGYTSSLVFGAPESSQGAACKRERKRERERERERERKRKGEGSAASDLPSSNEAVGGRHRAQKRRRETQADPKRRKGEEEGGRGEKKETGLETAAPESPKTPRRSLPKSNRPRHPNRKAQPPKARQYTDRARSQKPSKNTTLRKVEPWTKKLRRRELFYSGVFGAKDWPFCRKNFHDKTPNPGNRARHQKPFTKKKLRRIELWKQRQKSRESLQKKIPEKNDSTSPLAQKKLNPHNGVRGEFRQGGFTEGFGAFPEQRSEFVIPSQSGPFILHEASVQALQYGRWPRRPKKRTLGRNKTKVRVKNGTWAENFSKGDPKKRRTAKKNRQKTPNQTQKTQNEKKRTAFPPWGNQQSRSNTVWQYGCLDQTAPTPFLGCPLQHSAGRGWGGGRPNRCVIVRWHTGYRSSPASPKTIMIASPKGAKDVLSFCPNQEMH